MTVSIEKFGKDHWSTFAYAECRIVDNKGVPKKEHMRCDIDRHPGHAHRGSGQQKYPTMLKGGVKLHDHDDWDCIDDLEAAGFIETLGTGINPVWKLTKKGKEVAGLLRGWKADGGMFAKFQFKGP